MRPTKALDAEGWFRGNIKWKLHSAQRVLKKAFDKSPSSLFVGNCSRQWGKSYWAVIEAISCAIRIPKAQIRYGAAFHSDLVEFIIPAFEKALEDCPRSIKGSHKKSGSKIIFPNGSVIKLVGLDKNPNGLRGNTLDLIIFDECGFVSNLDYLYKSIVIPATTHRPNAKIIFISTPPSTPAHAFVDYSQKAEVENSYATFTIFENPMVSAAQILRLMLETGCKIPNDGIDSIEVIKTIMRTKVIKFPVSWSISTSFRREYLCQFVTESDLAIIPEWEDEFVQDIPKDEFYNYYHRYVGLDLGVKDFTAGIFGYYDFKRASLIIEDEFDMSGPSMNTAILANKIKQKEKELWGEIPPFRRISDNNWPIMMLDFSHLHNLTFIATDKDNLEAMINEVRIMVQNKQIIIHPRCVKLIGCLKYGVWDEKKKKFARSSVYGHFDHLAALVYLVRNLAKHTNPIPTLHGHDQYKSWTANVSDHALSGNARTIKNTFSPKKSR